MERTLFRALTIIGIRSAIAVSLHAAETSAPLFEGMGNHHHPITTTSTLAQRYFDQGMTLLFNFNHAEAARSFGAVAALDPACAMAYWGIAYAHGPNINAPMSEAQVPMAWDALQNALTRRDQASAQERDYINALAKRYTSEQTKDRSKLDLDYANAMRELAHAYPKDLDAQVLFAEALMDTSPWRYWETDLTPKPTAKEAIAVVESVLARAPLHPSAQHLYIHLMEAGPHPEKATRSADSLARFAPAAGHLVHMPSHIYVRIGRYHDGSTANELASKADESYLSQCRQQGMYPGGYYPHNLHFLWFATDLEGRSRDSIAAAKKIAAYTLDLRCGAIEGPRQRYLPLLAWARFGRWTEILEDPGPAEAYLFDRAMWHYARGLAFAAREQPDRAAQELAQFKTLELSEKVRGMDNPYFPGTKILNVAHLVLEAKVEGARGNLQAMVKKLREAVAAESNLSYMEPPYWYYSTRESLGAALLKAGRAAEAESVFRDGLSKLPNNGRMLFGLEQSLRTQHKHWRAWNVQGRFQRAWMYADTPLDLSWL